MFSEGGVVQLDYLSNDKMKITNYPLIKLEKRAKIGGFFMEKDIEEAEDISDFYEIEKIAESIKNISESAFLVYEPIVEDICSRKFYDQYPEIIADYVMFYKEMYGEE